MFDRSMAEINGIVVSQPMNWASSVRVYVFVCVSACPYKCTSPSRSQTWPFHCNDHKLQDKSFWLITKWQLYTLCHQWAGYCLAIAYFYANLWIRKVWWSVSVSLRRLLENPQFHWSLAELLLLWGWKKKPLPNYINQKISFIMGVFKPRLLWSEWVVWIPFWWWWAGQINRPNYKNWNTNSF